MSKVLDDYRKANSLREIAVRRGWQGAEDMILVLMDTLWREMTPEERLNWSNPEWQPHEYVLTPSSGSSATAR